MFLIVAVLWLEANGKPLFQGISFQRGFEINFKPLPRNPITFIKEKWSPFGVFGRKHSLQKRHSGSIASVEQAEPVVPVAPEVLEPRPAAPVFEHVEETENLHTPPLITLPKQAPRSVVPLLISTPVPSPLSPIQPQLISPLPPIISSPAPPPVPTSVIVTSVPPAFRYVPPLSITPEVVIIPQNKPITNDVLLQPSPVRMEGALPPISSNMVIPPPASGRFTDVTGAVPLREYMDSIQPIPPPPAVEEKATPPIETNSIKPEPPRNDFAINENSLVRGSKIALYFGSIFLQLMSQFMSNARATFDQMTNPPPVFNN